MPVEKLEDLRQKIFPTAAQFKKALSERIGLTYKNQAIVMAAAEIDALEVTESAILRLDRNWFTDEQIKALEKLKGRHFTHKWQLDKALAAQSRQWRFRKNDRSYNKGLRNKLTYLYKAFRSGGDD